MVVGIKDNLCYKDHKVSAASKILNGFESLFTATSVQRILDEDAIIIGRLNCDEFAMGSANQNTIYGTVKNPLDNSKVAGGSSGGSAAAVAAGLCLAALGSDTGGSIRQPASFCGVVGIKPTYSRVSRHGLIAYASSFDQIGPLTNNVEDAAIILEVISGKDDFDSTVSSKKVEAYSKASFDKKSKKIAYIKECLERDGLDPDVKQFIEEKIITLKKKGHIVEPISFPYLELLVPVYYVITTAEASSNLARFDGIHYGYRTEKDLDLDSTYINSRTEGFGEEVKRRIMLGTFVLSAGYHEAYFTKAQKIRRLIQQKTKNMFESYDFIISPTTPHTAFEIDQKNNNPTAMYLEDIFTVQANLSGNPAISLPLGKHSNGLPIGLQIMADNFKESNLLAFSKYLFN
jgi:aspartyl-tRNA(Asn)/glutamyl-tRNA(Gln) amidotransferase subunit A